MLALGQGEGWIVRYNACLPAMQRECGISPARHAVTIPLRFPTGRASTWSRPQPGNHAGDSLEKPSIHLMDERDGFSRRGATEQQPLLQLPRVLRRINHRPNK